MNRIVVATDGSEHGHYAVEQALALAAPTGTQVTIVFVRHVTPPVLGSPFYQRTLSAQLRQAEEVGAGAEAQATAAGVEVEVEVLEGDPARRIVELARARDADLIVVGSRARSSIVGTLLGSVSREVLRDADRPVLVAARPAARRAAA